MKVYAGNLRLYPVNSRSSIPSSWTLVDAGYGSRIALVKVWGPSVEARVPLCTEPLDRVKQTGLVYVLERIGPPELLVVP